MNKPYTDAELEEIAIWSALGEYCCMLPGDLEDNEFQSILRAVKDDDGSLADLLEGADIWEPIKRAGWDYDDVEQQVIYHYKATLDTLKMVRDGKPEELKTCQWRQIVLRF